MEARVNAVHPVSESGFHMQAAYPESSMRAAQSLRDHKLLDFDNNYVANQRRHGA
jgi:hypothetical protein